MTDRYERIRDPAEEVEQACAARAALAAPQQQWQAVYQIENDPEEWFDVDRAMYEGHDGSRKRILYSAAPLPDAQPEEHAGGAVAAAWNEGYRAGVHDERMSEANIGIAGFGAKVEPARNNPYTTPPAKVPEGWRLVPEESLRQMMHYTECYHLHFPTSGAGWVIPEYFEQLLAAAPAPKEDA